MSSCRQCTRGIHFAEGPICGRHATPEHRQLVDELDQRAVGLGIPKTKDPSWGSARAWPYGPNLNVEMRIRMLNWAEPLQLQLTPQSKRCMCWIKTGKRCAKPYSCRVGTWFDHVTGWTRNKQPALLLAQPYGVAIFDLTPVASEPALYVRTEGTGWYGHGSVAIEIWRRDAPEIIRQPAGVA